MKKEQLINNIKEELKRELPPYKYEDLIKKPLKELGFLDQAIYQEILINKHWQLPTNARFILALSELEKISQFLQKVNLEKDQLIKSTIHSRGSFGLDPAWEMEFSGKDQKMRVFFKLEDTNFIRPGFCFYNTLSELKQCFDFKTKKGVNTQFFIYIDTFKNLGLRIQSKGFERLLPIAPIFSEKENPWKKEPFNHNAIIRGEAPLLLEYFKKLVRMWKNPNPDNHKEIGLYIGQGKHQEVEFLATDGHQACFVNDPSFVVLDLDFKCFSASREFTTQILNFMELLGKDLKDFVFEFQLAEVVLKPRTGETKTRDKKALRFSLQSKTTKEFVFDLTETEYQYQNNYRYFEDIILPADRYSFDFVVDREEILKAISAMGKKSKGDLKGGYQYAIKIKTDSEGKAIYVASTDNTAEIKVDVDLRVADDFKKDLIIPTSASLLELAIGCFPGKTVFFQFFYQTEHTGWRITNLPFVKCIVMPWREIKPYNRGEDLMQMLTSAESPKEKLFFDATEIQIATKILGRCIPKKPIREIFSYFYCTNHQEPDTRFTLSATNLDDTCYIKSIKHSESTVDLVMKYGDLKQAVDVIPKNQASVELHLFESAKDPVLEIAEGVSFNLKKKPSDDYPELPDLREFLKPNFLAKVEISAKTFLDLYSKTVDSVAHDETRYYLGGFYVEIIFRGEQVKLAVTAVDGHRLSSVLLDADEISGALPPGSKILQHDGFAACGVIMSLSFFSNIAAFLKIPAIKKINPTVHLYYDSFDDQHRRGGGAICQLYLPWFEVLLHSRLIEGNFPDYRDVIPDSFDLNYVCDRKAFIAAVQNVLPKGSKGEGVILYFKGKAGRNVKQGANAAALIESIEKEVEDLKPGFLHVIYRIHSSYSKSSIEILDGPPDSFIVGPNAKYVLETASSIEGNILNIQANDENNPIALQGDQVIPLERKTRNAIMTMRL